MTATDSRRWWALGALSLSVLVVALDLFVLTLALPTLSADLHASSGDLQWFVDAYSLVLAAALLPAGMLGDRIGRKRSLIGALALFGLSSLACAYSTSAGELIAARAVLGLAAAVILPMSLAVLPVLFTAAERPRAIAAVGGATFLGYPDRPDTRRLAARSLLVGLGLPDQHSRSSSSRSSPSTLLMPESHGERRSHVDVTGIVISSAGLTSLTYGLIKAGDDGWSDPVAIVTMVAGAGRSRRVRRVGAAGEQGRPGSAATGCRWWTSGSSARPDSPGEPCWPPWSRSPSSGSSSRCRSTSSTCAASTRSAPGCGCCR